VAFRTTATRRAHSPLGASITRPTNSGVSVGWSRM
jgi:hypothetical protein